AEVAHIACEDGVELVDQLDSAEFGLQLFLLGLANLVTHLAIEPGPYRVDRWGKRELHRQLVTAARQIGTAPDGVSQFDVRGAEIDRDLARRVDKRGHRVEIVAQDASVIEERHRHDAAAEQARPHEDEREPSDNGRAAPDGQVDALVPERTRDDLAPAP